MRYFESYWPLSKHDSELEMHDEIFHFEIFKNFMKFLKYFMKFLIFNIK